MARLKNFCESVLEIFWNEGSFWVQIICFPKLPTWIWNLKTMPVNNESRTLTCEHKIWGKFVILLFLMSLKPGGNINQRLISGFSSCLKNYREVSKLPWNLYSWTKLHSTMVTNATECGTLIKFIFLKIGQSNPSLFFHSFKWNRATMRWNCFSRPLHFL